MADIARNEKSLVAIIRAATALWHSSKKPDPRLTCCQHAKIKNQETRPRSDPQASETLGFGNVWLAEHHFSTYGYLSRPAQLATYIAAKTSRIRVGTAVIV